MRFNKFKILVFIMKKIKLKPTVINQFQQSLYLKFKPESKNNNNNSNNEKAYNTCNQNYEKKSF